MKGRGEDRMAAWLKERLPRAELDATIRLKYVPNRAATTNQSPDFLVELEVRIPLFPETPLVVRVPLLVEVEAGAGFETALLDLERFVERSTDGSGRQPPVVELPFVAATESGGDRRLEVVRVLPVRFTAVEVRNGD